MNNQRVLFLEGLQETLIRTAIRNKQRLKELQLNKNKSIEEYKEMHFRQDYFIGNLLKLRKNLHNVELERKKELKKRLFSNG